MDKRKQPMAKIKRPKKQKIIITVEGGVIQDVDIPTGVEIEVEVRDYDVEGFEGGSGLKKDKAGNEYIRSIY